MEIIPEVARNSGTLICRKDRATLYRFSQNLISSEHFYNVEHSDIRSSYLLPSVRIVQSDQSQLRVQSQITLKRFFTFFLSLMSSSNVSHLAYPLPPVVVDVVVEHPLRGE